MNMIIDTLRPLSFRGKARLLAPFVPIDRVVVVNVNGYKMKLDLKDYIQRMIYIGAFERQETSTVKRRIRPGDTFVDVGANVGYFSLLASGIVGSKGRVVSFEPSNYVASLLCETVEVNAIENIDVCRFALGRTNSIGVLSDVLPTNHSPTFFLPGTGPSVQIRLLDDVLIEKKIDKVDLLKVDVEGYEMEVLAGAEKAMSSGLIRAILIEFNSHWLCEAGASSAKLHDLLSARGFHCAGHSQAPSEPLVNRLYVRK